MPPEERNRCERCTIGIDRMTCIDCMRRALWPWDRPKGTNEATVRNLYELGLIEPAPMPITMYALRLTEAGRRARYEAGFAGTEPA